MRYLNRITIWFIFLYVSVVNATTIYFFPANHDDANGSPANITQQANFSPICSAPGLPGLDLVRAYTGASKCPSNTEDIGFDTDIDYVFLVDDTSRLSDYMIHVLEEKQLLRLHEGRPVVNSGARSFVRANEDTGMNVLVVGEMDYRDSGSNSASWFIRLSEVGGNSNCELPEESRTLIEDFSQQTVQMNDAIKSTMLSALANFETAMSFESSYNTRPQIGSALGKAAIAQARSYIVGKISSQVPGFDIIIAFADSANAEIQRAETAARSQSMGDWIQRTRTFINDCLGNSRCGSSSGNVSEMTSQSLKNDVEMAVCRLSENRRVEGMDAISESLNNSLVSGRSSIKVFEKGLYEGWINSYYQQSQSTSNRANGTITVTWEVEERDNGTLVFELESYESKVDIEDYGDNADDALNTIIDQVADVSNPLDFLVRKKICFVVDNIMPGGRSDVCWLLNEDNSILQHGVGSTDMARRAFINDYWREHTTRFRR
jgi:hypothetical protein